VVLVVVLGLLAGFLFAASASLQQHAARRTATAAHSADSLAGRAIVRPLLALISELVRNPLWLVGWCTNLFGFVVQAAALHLGSVALVQPLLVTQLLFAMPLSTAWARRWPASLEWFGAGAVTAGVVVFLLFREVAPVTGEPDRVRVILAGFAAVVLVGALVLAAAGRPPLVHATLVSVAAGLCFAMSAVLMKLTTDDLVHRGVAATAVDWPGYSLAISTLVGLLLEQSAFATGSLSAAVAAMTITNPLASYLLGVLAFRVVPPASPGALAALAGSGALLIIGVSALSRSPSVRRPDAVSTGPGRGMSAREEDAAIEAAGIPAQRSSGQDHIEEQEPGQNPGRGQRFPRRHIAVDRDGPS
jgi:drug/metabolite transporter (DMT)-like permease